MFRRGDLCQDSICPQVTPPTNSVCPPSSPQLWCRMEDALRSLGMAPHPPGGDPGSSPVWQGGSEHGIMDASYYLDDLLRNMHGNAADGGDTAGGARGPSHLQVSGRWRPRLVQHCAFYLQSPMDGGAPQHALAQ